MKEPQIHSHITDGLPKDHPLAFEAVYCSTCGEMLHCDNNECMQTWIETGKGNYCAMCFSGINTVDMLDHEFGLKDEDKTSQLLIDWDSGEGLKIDPEIEAVIRIIAAMANKHNDNDDYEMAEQIARAALDTALYNPRLIRDILVRLERQTDDPPKA